MDYPELGGYTATQYLIELGHRHIACISKPQEVSPGRERLAGFYRALQEAGLPVRPIGSLRVNSQQKVAIKRHVSY